MGRATWVGLLSLFCACGARPSESSVQLRRGQSTVVGVLVPGFERFSSDPSVERAPWTVTAEVPPDGGISASVGITGPNRAEVLAHVFISAAVDAPFGLQRVSITTPNGPTGIDVTVVAPPAVRLTPGLGRRKPVAVAGPVTLWVREDGTVWQRTVAGDQQVPGLEGAHSVAVSSNPPDFLGVAATANAVWWWTSTRAPSKLVDLEAGVAELTLDAFGSYAVSGDGLAWKLSFAQGALSAKVVEDFTDVVSVRVSGRFQQIQGTLDSFTQVRTVFMRSDGTAAVVDTVDSTYAPSTRNVTTRGPGLRVVGANDETQDADGIVYRGNVRLHDFPARHLESASSFSQQNASNSGSSRSIFVLFDDGALWVTSFSSSFGLNNQGAPTSSSNITQVPVLPPGNVSVLDFTLAGNFLWTTAGTFVTGAPTTPENPFGFTSVTLPGLARPQR
jgi:hypothetical protein